MSKLIYRESDYGLEWSFYDMNNDLVSTYVFKSKLKNRSDTGSRLLKITMCRFAVMDLLNVPSMSIESLLSKEEATYLIHELDKFKDHSSDYHGIDIPIKTLGMRTIEESFNKIRLSKEDCYLGYTGGKDSSLTLELIEGDFKKLQLFKINFDEEPFLDNYHIACKVHNTKLYNQYSTKAFFNSLQVKYYQEEDLHAVFAAPYYNVIEGDPANLALGMPWDTLNSYVYKAGSTERASEYVMTETQNSLKCFRKLMHYYGLIDFDLFSPLATLNSFAIYNILRKKYGDNKLKSMLSCWNPVGNKSCGKCTKCQRVSYIYKVLNIPLSDNEINSLSTNTKELDYLFGSISIKKLLENNLYNKLKFDNCVLIDPEIINFDRSYHQKISEKYELSVVKNPFFLE